MPTRTTYLHCGCPRRLAVRPMDQISDLCRTLCEAGHDLCDRDHGRVLVHRAIGRICGVSKTKCPRWVAGSSHRRQAFIQLGRDALGDTSYSFGRAHVHLNLVDMTAPCAAKRPVLEAHARRCSAQNFRARLAHRAADLRDGGRQHRFFNL